LGYNVDLWGFSEWILDSTRGKKVFIYIIYIYSKGKHNYLFICLFVCLRNKIACELFIYLFIFEKKRMGKSMNLVYYYLN
jgi:hypothetical protein